MSEILTLSGLPAGRHPEAEAVHRYADGVLEGPEDADVAIHVVSCAECREEVERVRQVAATLALTSPAPADLLERIQRRRAAGESVVLPTMDDAPAITASVDDVARDTTVEEERRASAALSLTSAPPADLFARIAARRAAGERVVLPSVPDAPAAASPMTPTTVTVRPLPRPAAARARSWRWAAAPASIAAVALLTVLVRRDDRGVTPRADTVSAPSVPAIAPSTAPSIASPSGAPTTSVAPTTVAPAAPARHASPPARARERLRSAADAPSSTPNGQPADTARRTGTTTGALVSRRDGEQGLAIGLAAQSALAAEQVAVLDSLVELLKQHADRRVIIRYEDPAFRGGASPSWRLAGWAADHLVLGGVEAERITLVRVTAVNRAGLARDADAVEMVVRTTP